MPLTDVVVRKAKSNGKTCKLSDERDLYLELEQLGENVQSFNGYAINV